MSPNKPGARGRLSSVSHSGKKSVSWATDPPQESRADDRGGVGPDIGDDQAAGESDKLIQQADAARSADWYLGGPDGAAGRVPPCCFQCRFCKVILGDTCDWVTSNRAAMTISLEVAREVQVHDELHMSNKGEDYGSVFSKITCKVCKKELGKMYRNTSPEFDLARNCYTFDAENILCYILGSNRASHIARRPHENDETNKGSKVDINVLDNQVGKLFDAVNGLSQKFINFKDEHVKMENVFLVWEQRISQLEQAVAQIPWNRAPNPRTNGQDNPGTPANLSRTDRPDDRQIRYDARFREDPHKHKRPREAWNFPP